MKLVWVAVVACFAGLSAASAAGTCVSNAVDKNGKPLVGAAKTSFMNKCTQDAQTSCEANAVDKNGKPLAGAAKTANVTKCVNNAVGS